MGGLLSRRPRDGALIVIPPDLACRGIIDPLPERLRGLIRRHNHVSCQAAGIQLRAAAHIGPVEHDGYGSSAPTSTCYSACWKRDHSGTRSRDRPLSWR